MLRQFVIPRNALFFNGTSDYAAIPALSFPSSDFNGAGTVSLWVFLARASGNSPFFDNAWASSNNVGGWQFYINSGNTKVNCNTYGTSTSSPDTSNIGFGFVPIGQWFHLLVTKNTIERKQITYVNGVAVSTNSGTSYGFNPPTTQLAIGKTGNNQNNFCHCMIADIVMWNRDLTSTEANLAYLGSYPSSGLIHHWDFHEGSGSVVSDLNGGPSFVINSATWTTFMPTRTIAS